MQQCTSKIGENLEEEGLGIYYPEDKEFVFRINIEIKPHILSLGDTIRQINYYKNYTFSKRYYLITKDNPYENAFTENNICFIDYNHLKQLFKEEKN